MKKFACLLLTVLLVFSSVGFAFAADTQKCDCGKAPVVFIVGLGGSFYDGDTLVFPPQKDTIISAVTQAIPATPALLSGVLKERQQERILNVAGTFFEPIAFTKEGEPANNTKKRVDYPESFDHKNGEFIVFDYDWRLDPFEVAAQLKEFIENVKQQTGHDSVYLVGESMGTVEMNTYLATYGFGGIEGVVWYNGAYKGVASCSDSFANKNNFTAESLSAFLKQLSVSSDNQFLYDLFTALDAAGLLGTVFDSVLSGADSLEESGMFSRFLREYIGRIPGFWGLVSSENYQAARDFAFPTPELQEEYAVLLAKLDRYHNEVSSKADEIMQTAKDVTGKVGLVCGYGEIMPPVTSDNTRQSDSVILTVDESNGATCAPLGQTLGDDYVQKINDGHNHISPDRVIDASTAFFPDNTWFIKFGHHSFSGGKELVSKIFFTEGFDVFADENYPQFMVRNMATGEVTPLTAENGEGGSLTAGVTSRLLKVFFWISDVFLKIYKAIAGLAK